MRLVPPPQIQRQGYGVPFRSAVTTMLLLLTVFTLLVKLELLKVLPVACLNISAVTLLEGPGCSMTESNTEQMSTQ